jgi:hypothetical protein
LIINYKHFEIPVKPLCRNIKPVFSPFQAFSCVYYNLYDLCKYKDIYDMHCYLQKVVKVIKAEVELIPCPDLTTKDHKEVPDLARQ